MTVERLRIDVLVGSLERWRHCRGMTRSDVAQLMVDRYGLDPSNASRQLTRLYAGSAGIIVADRVATLIGLHLDAFIESGNV